LKTKEEIKVSWKKYGELMTELSKIVRASEEKFDMVIGISRGGLLPALFLSYALGDIPLAIMAAQSYNKRFREENIIFSRHLVMTTKSIGKRCLLVDDLAHSGRTLEETVRFLKNKYGNKMKKLLTAVMFEKSCSKFQPDFVVKKIGEEWVKFFYEGLIPKEK
jgi:hypoxanthine phosphoribosyltransferase